MEWPTKRGRSPGRPPGDFFSLSSTEFTDKVYYHHQLSDLPTKTTTATSALQHSRTSHKTPQLGDFSSLDLLSLIHAKDQLLDNDLSSDLVPAKPASHPPPSAQHYTPGRPSRLPYNLLTVPKLGNFSSLEAYLTPPPSIHSPSDTTGYSGSESGTDKLVIPSETSLGDFSKLFEQFGYTLSSSNISHTTAAMDRQGRCCYPPAPHYYWPAPQHYPYAPYGYSPAPQHYPYAPHGYSPAAPRYCPVPQHYPPARWCDCDWNTQKASANAQALCIDTQVAPYRHPHARYGEAAHRDSSSDRKSQSSSPDLTGNETDETTPASSPVKRSLSYSQRTCRKNGPEAFHYTNGDGSKTSVTVSEVKQQLIDSSSLAWAQQGHDRLDEAANRMFPMNTGGVHVFLDVSNIYISFLNTIKEGLNIPPNTKIWPQPDFDWKALTELVLCRGRQASTLMAGCSLNPHDRQPPSYIKTLEDIGFTVDVRTRKRKEDGSYKEFMVDECIQAAIEDVVSPRNGAIVKPGTLLIVTGDGKPAEHSSGFVKYASHAIDDGWKIEVVNWNTGCSTKWVPEDWKGYGARYRRIALDDYLGGLLGSKFT